MGNNYSSSPPPKVTLPSPPQVEASHEVHRLANNVFECVFSSQIEQKTHFKYKLIVTCSSQEPTVEEFSLSGDSFNQDTNMAFISFMVDENQVFSSRIETMTGIIVHSLDNFSTTSFKPATKKLLKRKMDKKEIMERILESMKKINQEIVISTVSIASSGKSTILNTLLRVLGSLHLSFRQGNTDMMEKAYQILESASQLSAEFMGSFSKDIVKQTIDDVAQFHLVNLQDVPGMFTFSGTNGPRLFKFSKELLTKVFSGTVKEFAQPDSVFIPIPLKDATMYSTRNDNNKGLADFFQSTMSYVENEYSVPCVICYSHVDRCYLFDNYIGKGRILLDARGKSNRNANLKLDLLKYFYEWDLIGRDDGTFPDIVESTHNIPFISNYDGDEEIQELFACMHLELFLLLIEQAYAKISSRKTIKLELIKKE